MISMIARMKLQTPHLIAIRYSGPVPAATIPTAFVSAVKDIYQPVRDRDRCLFGQERVAAIQADAERSPENTELRAAWHRYQDRRRNQTGGNEANQSASQMRT